MMDKNKFARSSERKNWDERSLWSDSLSAARVLVMWKGRRVLMGVVVRRTRGDALERRASLVRRDIAVGWWND